MMNIDVPAGLGAPSLDTQLQPATKLAFVAEALPFTK